MRGNGMSIGVVLKTLIILTNQIIIDYKTPNGHFFIFARSAKAKTEYLEVTIVEIS
jgi:hypothetical protein